MSKWYDPKIEDMWLSEDEEELDILIDTDDDGNIYTSLKVKDIKKVLKEKKKLSNLK